MSKSDHEYFNCSQKHEHEYVISLYSQSRRAKVRQFLKENCDSGVINNFTHKQVYDLIESKLGYKRD